MSYETKTVPRPQYEPINKNARGYEPAGLQRKAPRHPRKRGER